MEKLTDRIARRVVIDDGGCHLWQGALVNGYAQIAVAGKTMRAHRALYEELHGPLPSSVAVHHTCGTRRCLNPEHFEPMLHSEHARLHTGRGSLFRRFVQRFGQGERGWRQ